MINHNLQFRRIFLLAVVLIVAQSPLSYADGGKVKGAIPGLFNRYFSDKRHPFPITAGFASALSSVQRNETQHANQDIQEWFTATGLYRLLSHRLETAKEIAQADQLHNLSKLSLLFEFYRDTLLKPDISSNLTRRDQEPSIVFDDERPILSPGIYHYSYRSLISVSLPIAATDSLTIAPIISSTFPLNGSDHHDYGSKGILSLFDKDASIIYAGLYMKYTF